MKRILLTLVAVALAVPFICAQNNMTTQQAADLPMQARNFLTQYFPSTTISHIKIENDILRSMKEYEVKLNDGTEIEFDTEGNWKEIDMKRQRIPDGIVPQLISSHVVTTYPALYVTKIKKDRRGTEVELNNDLELKFNTKGRLIKIDD